MLPRVSLLFIVYCTFTSFVQYSIVSQSFSNLFISVLHLYRSNLRASLFILNIINLILDAPTTDTWRS